MRLNIKLIYIYLIANRASVLYTFNRAKYYNELIIDNKDKSYKD